MLVCLVWLGLLTVGADPEAGLATGDIPAELVPFASQELCDFQGKWHLMLDKSDTLDAILGGLQFGWIKKKALRNYAPTTYIRFTEPACYTDPDQLDHTLALVDYFSPAAAGDDDVFAESVTVDANANATVVWDQLTDDDADLLEGMASTTSTSTSAPAEPTYMYMKTLFPWHNIKEGVVSIDGPAFTHKDSDTGLWHSTVSFKDGRLFQKRTSPEHGVMYDIRAIFNPVESTTTTTEAEDAAAGVAPDADGPLDPRTWTGERLMLFKWTLVGLDGQVYHATRWNRLVGDIDD